MSYYKVLGVEPDASLVDINRAYRKLSLQFNPEKNLYEGGFYIKMFNQVQEAYAILNNEEKRKEYDIENGFISVEAEEVVIVEEKIEYPPKCIERTNITSSEKKIIVNKGISNNIAIKLMYVFIFLIIAVVFYYDKYIKT